MIDWKLVDAACPNDDAPAIRALHAALRDHDSPPALPWDWPHVVTPAMYAAYQRWQVRDAAAEARRWALAAEGTDGRLSKAQEWM